jgi:hypothetical protein
MQVPTPTITQGESTMSYTHLSMVQRSKLESSIIKELDTVVSKGCVATLVERKTRVCPLRFRCRMEIAFGVAASQYPAKAFQTATADRGKEFVCLIGNRTMFLSISAIGTSSCQCERITSPAPRLLGCVILYRFKQFRFGQKICLSCLKN